MLCGEELVGVFFSKIFSSTKHNEELNALPSRIKATNRTILIERIRLQLNVESAATVRAWRWWSFARREFRIEEFANIFIVIASNSHRLRPQQK